MIRDIDSDDSIQTIEKSTTISSGNNILFEYDHVNGILAINMSEEFLVNLNIGEIPVDLCFPKPGMLNEHYCFKNVSKIRRINQDQGLIKRFTKFLFRR